MTIKHKYLNKVNNLKKDNNIWYQDNKEITNIRICEYFDL